jgi:hypothetical protein
LGGQYERTFGLDLAEIDTLGQVALSEDEHVGYGKKKIRQQLGGKSKSCLARTPIQNEDTPSSSAPSRYRETFIQEELSTEGQCG